MLNWKYKYPLLNKILKARFKSMRNKLSLLVIKYDNYSYVLPSCVNLC